jgi:hypothetical protein
LIRKDQYQEARAPLMMWLMELVKMKVQQSAIEQRTLSE